MKFRRPVSDEAEGPQLAPMIDIFFLMLIFFMVASVYAQYERNISLVVPKAQTSEESSRYPGEVIINIDKEGKFFVNSVEKDVATLDAMLENIASVYTGQPIIIRCDAKTNFESYVKVFDLCRSHAIENVRIATLEDEAK